ncbi:30S ribosomal protein S12 methylthiotransferase RimO [Candidatus Latescibacterota bacterium]
MSIREASTPPKAALITLGCPMNQVDSEEIMGGLVSLGFEIVPEEKADIIVVNTCCFIDDARKESIDTIMSIAQLKKTANLKSLVIAGCLAERYRAELERDLTEADAVAGLKDRAEIPNLCLELLNNKHPEDKGYSRVVTGPLHSAYLRIAEGCSNRCSYCAIPMIRGPYRSRPEAEIIGQAEELASLGTRELMLIAQDTTGYGIDLDDGSLPGLLMHLSEIEGIEWIRLLYAHPAHCLDVLVEAMANLPKVLPYIDIPIQHVSPSILKRMGRFTPPEKIRTLIDKLRESIEGMVIRTSLMVGFPGETDADFRKLIEFVEDIRFERLGAFVYSREEETPAASLDNQVPDEVAFERYETLMEVQSHIAMDFHRSLVGREFEMIVDAVDSETRTLEGRSYMDAPDVDGNITAAGSVEDETAFCRVRITGADNYDLKGEVV